MFRAAAHFDESSFLPAKRRSHFSLALLRFPVNAGGYMILLNSLPNTHAGVEKTLRK